MLINIFRSRFAPRQVAHKKIQTSMFSVFVDLFGWDGYRCSAALPCDPEVHANFYLSWFLLDAFTMSVTLISMFCTINRFHIRKAWHLHQSSLFIRTTHNITIYSIYSISFFKQSGLYFKSFFHEKGFNKVSCTKTFLDWLKLLPTFKPMNSISRLDFVNIST